MRSVPLLFAFVVVTTMQSATADPPRAEEAKDKEQAAPILLEAKPGRIVGEVVDEEGRPIAGVLVDAWTWWKGTETTTDAQGRFSLNPKTEPRERAEVRFSKPGYSPHYIIQQPVGAEPIRIVLDSKTYIAGTITDINDKPVVGATVRGVQSPQRGDGVLITGVTTETLTDEFGRYQLYLFPETYDIKVSASKRGVARIPQFEVPSDEGQILDIKLSEGVHFEAKVVDAVTGEAVEGFVLWSWRERDAFGKSDKNGKLTIDGLLPGSFKFKGGGGEPIQLEQIKGDIYRHGPFGRWWSEEAANQWERKLIQPGEFQRNLDDLEFNLATGMKPVTIVVERGVVFTGKVFDPDGNPVAGATVAPAKTGSGNSLTGDTRYSVETEEDGSYRVVMPAGNDFEYNLIVHDGKYGEWRTWANGITETIESHPGDEIEVDLTLSRPCTVRGKVTAVGDHDLSKLKVRAHAFDLHENRYYDPTTTTTDKDGHFELKFIRPGKQYIQVEPFWLNAGEAPGPSTVILELSEGETRKGIELEVSDNSLLKAAP